MVNNGIAVGETPKIRPALCESSATRETCKQAYILINRIFFTYSHFNRFHINGIETIEIYVTELIFLKVL